MLGHSAPPVGDFMHQTKVLFLPPIDSSKFQQKFEYQPGHCITYLKADEAYIEQQSFDLDTRITDIRIT